MKLWSFTFCSPESRLRSGRLVAADRGAAAALISQMLGTPLDAGQPRLGADIILQYAGETARAESAILSVVTAAGETLVNEEAA